VQYRTISAMENAMKTLTHLMLLAGLVSMPLAAVAEDSPHTITGNLSFVSDYQYRGISQTDEDPAIQGGFDYAHSSGFYLGTWGSNVDANFYGNANMEWDLYGGYSGSAGDLGYNVGLLQYYYPDNTIDADTLEAYAGVTYKGFGLKASYSTGEYFGIADSEGTVYWDASYGYTFENGVGLNLHYGYTAGEGAQYDYADWKVGVTFPVGKFTVGLAYTDNDISSTDCNLDICDSRLILSVGTTF